MRTLDAHKWLAWFIHKIHPDSLQFSLTNLPLELCLALTLRPIPGFHEYNPKETSAAGSGSSQDHDCQSHQYTCSIED